MPRRTTTGTTSSNEALYAFDTAKRADHGTVCGVDEAGRGPRSGGFQIVLRDHVKSIPVAQLIDAGGIRVMTGADRIDIVLLHRDNILQNFFFRNGTSCF